MAKRSSSLIAVKHTTTEEQVSLRVDFVKWFGVPVKSPDLRQSIADDLIQIILDRTQSGYGVEKGEIKKFQKLTKKYADRVGKALSPVTLDLFGDMLNAIKPIESNRNYVDIGIAGDQAPKAHGHMTGQYGKGPLPRRSFLGLTGKDLDKLKSRYIAEVQSSGFKKASEFLDQENVSTPEITREDILAALRELRNLRVEGS
jgi:hypothetical protein